MKSIHSFDKLCLAIGSVLLMYKSTRILYVRNVSEILIYLICFACFAIYLIYNYSKLERISGFKAFSVLLVAVIYFYDRTRLALFTLPSVFTLLTVILGATLLITAPVIHKKYVYNVFTVTTEIIIGVGLIGWILFLLNFPLPHYVDNSDNFYHYDVYYVFNLVLSRGGYILPRYAGPFLEPGHLGTMCVFLLFINGFRLKKFGNIILLLAVLFSLSLAAYGLLVGAVIIHLLIKRKFVWVGAMTGLFILIGFASQFYNNGENPLYQFIVSRLELNENGDDIVGNNRTSMFFDLNYAKYLKTDKVWLGYGKAAFGTRSDGSDNVTIGTAGYKRYFYLRGIVGSFLIILFIFIYWRHYLSVKSTGFLIIYIIANLIRDYPTNAIWMYLFILAIPLLYYNPKYPDPRKALSEL